MSKPLHGLKQFVRTCPAIDNHGHNLLRTEKLPEHPLLSITSEASDEALKDAPTTLAHIRAAKQLRVLYSLPLDADWVAIEAARQELLTKPLDGRYLENVETILIDDGYEDAENIETYDWHSQFTRSPCKRILRIEEVLSDFVEGLHEEGKLPRSEDDEACKEVWEDLVSAFKTAIVDAIDDPEVVGFKSVICYLTGLDVDTETKSADGLAAFQTSFLSTCVANEFAIECKPINDFFVSFLCTLLSTHSPSSNDSNSTTIIKPLQFHTGLGDNAMSLLKSNPAHLQPLISAFPTVPVVLLHSSYPYTREAGYLASVYSNCYLDLGLVWPEISRDGQERVNRQALELTPWSKLVWSTDGHYLPETYWLAGRQGREALGVVLGEYVEKGDLSIEQAKTLTREVLFDNSNRLYGLGLEFKM